MMWPPSWQDGKQVPIEEVTSYYVPADPVVKDVLHLSGVAVGYSAATLTAVQHTMIPDLQDQNVDNINEIEEHLPLEAVHWTWISPKQRPLRWSWGVGKMLHG